MKTEAEWRADPDDAPDPRPDRTAAALLAVAALLLIGVISVWLWSTREEQQPLVPEPRAQAAVPPEETPAAAGDSHPRVRHPVPEEDAPLAADEIPGALAGLLGTKAASTFLRTDSFPRRLVATMDSLARDHSPPSLWPVLATPGRLIVEERPDGPAIAPENSARYTPLVLLAGTIDAPSAARLYRRMYPALQQAYRDLGFGDRHLNDRLVEVIDLLLATPDAPESPRLHLVEVNGPIPSLQPWVRYQFAEPELEALSAGQKILVRVGPVNQRRLKSKLAELRKELTGWPLAAATARADATEAGGGGAAVGVSASDASPPAGGPADARSGPGAR